ncbi:unnamed protein product [Porites evermanni]|uniref:Uncharacterized protein n=1 Tax=Porites evermanni TaxID=104178 RepID=A0ABN8R4E4_9CNID|nr:unnamed protein product [Porites evermanni]
MFLPTFKIPGDSERKRKSSSSMLRAAIKGNNVVKSEGRIYTRFPEKGSHRNHIIEEAGGIQQQMEQMVAQKIQYLVGSGI